MQVVLPIGISFYTFHSLTYIIDLYRGHATPAKSFTDFSAFVALFPDLVAGPIIRYKTLAAQLALREHTLPRFATGVTIFVLGFAKKILLANPAGNVADAVFNAAQPGVVDAWFGVLAYAFQIYFDFCGYSDMAVGLGRMLGFEFPKNFDAPYRCGEHHRVLAAVAHFAVQRPARLPVFPAGRQSPGRGPHVRQPGDRDAAGRAVARRQVELPGVGRLPRAAADLRTLARQDQSLRPTAAGLAGGH